MGGVHEHYWKNRLKHIDRDIGAGVLAYIQEDKIADGKLKNSIEFANDSLFCEYCYVIDLDNMLLEIFKGFNEEVVSEGRFLSTDTSEKYQPVTLIKTYPIQDLPIKEQFLTDLEDE